MLKTILFIIVALLILVGVFLVSYRNKIVAPLSAEQRKVFVDQTSADIFKSVQLENSLPYRLYSPPAGSMEDLPLILYLHGAGGRGDDNIAQVEIPVPLLLSPEFQKRHPSFVVIPQCPRGHEWVTVKCSHHPLQNYNQDALDESVYLQMVMELLDTLKDRFPINSQQIYVMGFSMGATGTWDIITRHPDFFAGAIIFNGRSDPSKAFKIKNMPIQVFHGKYDRVSPITNANAMIDELKKIQSPVIFDALYWGHGIPRIAIKKKGLFSWLFSQSKKE